MRPLFIYGTLQDPEVFLMVTDRMIKHYFPKPVRLKNHAIYFVEGKTFPGLVKAQGQSTPGLLISGLNHSVLEKISNYETKNYSLSNIEVQIGNMQLLAQCYVPSDDLKLTSNIWRFEDWQIDDKMKYLNQLRGFIDSYS